MFCPNCGREVDDKAAVCVGCGRSLPKLNNNVGEQDSNSAGWWWLGFFIPVAGFIMWLVSSGTTPKKARKAGIGALVGIITTVVLYIAYFIFMFFITLFMAAGVNSYNL